MYLSLEDYRRRMLGCWIGKNVGGTLGMPMEWNRQPNDVTYYTHKMTGEPLPNDDLDIQVLWLLALEDKGLDIDCKVLGQYFNELMIFTHGEYGTAKTNLRAGLQPPVSGTHNNDFKDSCGSFIRSEIWACLFPGHPEKAAQYAFQDAVVDHGNGEGVYAEAGEKTCILAGELSGMLAHEAVGHTVEADIVMGGSVAAHMMGKRVASDLISMVDFAHTAFGKPAPLPVWIDDEGVVAKDAVLIRDGILTGYMHNRESAERYGAEPCGNARAFAFSDEPLIRMRNTAVLPGTSKLEDIIASVDDGYLLCDTNNGQADTTGEFMFGVTMGYESKKGKLVWASSGYCGKKQLMPVGLGGPALRCRVTIGGR